MKSMLMKSLFRSGRWLLFGLAGVLPTAAAPKFNVLFIAADDLRMNLGCFGDPVAQTPNLDRLARRGMLFERAYCQQALCNPSRSSLLTGLRPDTLRVWNLTTHFRETTPAVVTLPQYFQQNGYFTQNIGKIYHNWRTKIEGDPASWSVPAVLHFATHASDVAVVDGGQLPPNTARTRGAEARDVPDEAYFDGRVAATAVKALRILRECREPFFLGVGFWKPHAPFNPPKRYWDLYRRDEIPPLRNSTPPRQAPALALPESGEGGRDRSPAAVRELRHGYYAATSYLDAQVGKVIDELDRLGLGENTVIVFWSDNGYHLGEHAHWGKTTNFELDAHVPLIIAMPRMKTAGTRTASLVEFVDLYPTLVELCGLPEKSGLEGVSLRPILDDPRTTVKTAAFSQHPRPAYVEVPGAAMGYSLRRDRFRYTEWRDWGSGNVLATELYDHQSDPDEMANIVGEAHAAETVRTLGRQLRERFPPKALPTK